MYARTLRLLIAAGTCLAATMAVNPQQTQNVASSYRHGYFLFLAGAPSGCEDCYIPLLITRTVLEEMKTNSIGDDSVLITTFERDSIWQNNGLLRISQSDINTTERKVRVLGKIYRYQEIGSKETLHLLENPLGKIPISRIPLKSKLPAGPELKQLIADFQTVK